MSFTGLSRIHKGIRFRLTLVYTLLFGLFISIFAFILIRQFNSSSQAAFDSALLNYAIDLSEHLMTGNFHSAYRPGGGDLKKSFPFAVGQTHYSIRELDGSLLTGTDEIPYNGEIAGQKQYTHRTFTYHRNRHSHRAVNLKMRNQEGKEVILQVGTPSTILEEQQNRIALLNYIIIPLLMLLSGVVSFILAGRALAPIKLVTRSVNNIAATNLTLRLPEFQTGDEFQNLSVTFNGLLDRLQKAFEAQEHFVANVSHQLNTPLAIIKGELNVLESKPRTLEEHQKFNRSLREEVERLIELVKNLLLIARIEAGVEDSFRMRPLRLDDLLITTMSRMKLKARDKRITIRFNMSQELEVDDLVIEGERQLLDSMFENLLDNSIKYSPEGSVISIDVSKDQSVVVAIRDEGPGIRPSELDKILEKRFRRGEMTLLPGTGIGLSIVHKIAKHHKATISYEKLQPQGSLFIVHFAKQNL